MGLQVVAQGGDVGAFKEAISRTSGKGVTVIEVDVPDRPVLRSIVRGSLAAMDASIEAIPGHHLTAPSTYTDHGDTGTIRVQVSTNPVPFIGIGVALAVLAVAAIVGVVSWRILKFSAGDMALVIGGIALAVALAFILARRLGA